MTIQHLSTLPTPSQSLRAPCLLRPDPPAVGPVTTFSFQGAGRVDWIQNSGAERFDSHANSITWPQQHWTLMRVMR